MFQHPTHILSWVEPLTYILPFTLHIFHSHSLSHRRSARNQNTKGFSHSLTVLSLSLSLHFTSLARLWLNAPPPILALTSLLHLHCRSPKVLLSFSLSSIFIFIFFFDARFCFGYLFIYQLRT